MIASATGYPELPKSITTKNVKKYFWKMESAYIQKKNDLVEEMEKELEAYLLGSSLPLDIYNIQTGEIIAPAGRKLVKSVIAKIARAYDQLEIDPSPLQSRLRQILYPFKNRFETLEEEHNKEAAKLTPNLYSRKELEKASGNKLSVLKELIRSSLEEEIVGWAYAHHGPTGQWTIVQFTNEHSYNQGMKTTEKMIEQYQPDMVWLEPIGNLEAILESNDTEALALLAQKTTQGKPIYTLKDEGQGIHAATCSEEQAAKWDNWPQINKTTMNPKYNGAPTPSELLNQVAQERTTSEPTPEPLVQSRPHDAELSL